MSLTAFRPLASVSAQTEAGAIIDSLRFAPTPATAARLASHRLVVRSHDGGFLLAAQHDLASGRGPKVAIDEPLSLLFAITSSESDFLARHGGAETAKAGPNLFLTNRGADGTPKSGAGLSRGARVGAKDIGRIVPRRYRARVPLAPGARAKALELHSYFGGARIGQRIPVEAGARAEAGEASIDASAAPGVACLLRPKPRGIDQLIIADDELARMGPLGALELVLKAFPGTAPAAGRAFTATFEK